MDNIKIPTPASAFRIYCKNHTAELIFKTKKGDIKEPDDIKIHGLIGGGYNGDFGEGFNYFAKGTYEIIKGISSGLSIFNCILKLSFKPDGEPVVDAIRDNTITLE